MTASKPPFFTLPSELIHHILSLLSLPDLLSVGLVNRSLQAHSLQDNLYQNFVQSQVPGNTLSNTHNLTWRELYKSHHPFWFIPQRKIWFSDRLHTGNLMITRYDHRTNNIEGYALVAERRPPAFIAWEWNPDAIIHTFSPRIRLDLNVPLLRLNPQSYDRGVGDIGYRLQKEVPMDIYAADSSSSAGLYSRIMLTRPWPPDITSDNTPVWPPPVLPSPVRTRVDSPSQFQDISHRPWTLSDLSQSSFRIRKWMQFSSFQRGIGMRVGEEITTWATLPEDCYTPTPQKPWQGIWCGDYAGHGCEFLAILQPDDPKPLPEKAQRPITSDDPRPEGSLNNSAPLNAGPAGASAHEATDDMMLHHSATTASDLEDSVASLQAAAHEEMLPESEKHCEDEDEDSIYRGRIEAIKLTGDPNVPRGQYTFIAPDIGPEGLIRIATEDMFRGARIVRSVGHIAATGFTNDDYMTSQLILISHDRLAQYWETFGHVSFYQRVNIDDFTDGSYVPTEDEN